MSEHRWRAVISHKRPVGEPDLFCERGGCTKAIAAERALRALIESRPRLADEPFDVTVSFKGPIVGRGVQG